MTKKQAQVYTGKCCPVCGCGDIEGGPVEIESPLALQEMSCPECEEEWTDIYRLVHVRATVGTYSIKP